MGANLNFTIPAVGSAGPGWANSYNDALSRIEAASMMSLAQQPGVDSTGVTECSAAINTSINAAAAANGGQGQAIWAATGTYNIAANIVDLKSKVHIFGVYSGYIYGGGGTGFMNGTQFKYTGAANGTAVRMLNCMYAGLHGVAIDCGQIAGVTGLLIDSTNSPVTQSCTVERFAITRCGQLGAAPDGYGIRICQSTVSNYECDNITIREGHIDFTGTGISIESMNAMNASLIDNVIVGNNNTGLKIAGCGQMTVRGLSAMGSFYGPDPGFIRFTGQWNPILFTACQCEGTGAKSLIIQGVAGGTANTLSFVANTFGLPVEIRSSAFVYSEGNTYVTNGFTITSTATNVTVESHMDMDITAGTAMDSFVNNGGAGCYIGPARLVSTSKTAWTPGAIAAGATVTLSVAMTCSTARGDYAAASYDQMVNGLKVEGSVVATNVCNVYLTNTTGASITPAAGNARLEVRRPLG